MWVLLRQLITCAKNESGLDLDIVFIYAESCIFLVWLPLQNSNWPLCV